MNEKKLFENGCFLPDWASEDVVEESTPIKVAYSPQNKDLQTLLKEMDDIKSRLQEIKAKRWILEKMNYFYQNGLAE
jgi:hypothetical protein